jgi:hypothetical protein
VFDALIGNELFKLFIVNAKLAFGVVLWVAAGSSAQAQADLSGDMNAIARFCTHYVETGERTTALLEAGFSQRRREFRKSYSASFIGATQPYLTVDARESRAGFSCSVQVGIISRTTARNLLNIARTSSEALGYQQVQSGRVPLTVQRDGGVLMRLGGSVTSSHETYSAFIYWERLG